MDRQGIESLFNTCYNYIIYWEEEDMDKAVTVNDIPNFFKLVPLENDKDMQMYYEETMEIRTGHVGNSPMDDIFDLCTTPSEHHNAIMLLGHRGSGKSTELNKLSMKLRDDGHKVMTIPCNLNADIVNIEYADLMVLMADAMLNFANEVSFIPDKSDLDIIERFWDTVEKETDVNYGAGAGIETGISVETPKLFKKLLKVFATVKTDLKYNVDVRETYRKYVRNRIGMWLEALNNISDGVTKKCGYKQPILIFEDLDKGQDSVWNTFESYSAQLSGVTFPVIYTFPISYYYDPRFGKIDSFFEIHKLPMIKTNKLSGEPDENGPKAIRAIIERRMDVELFEKDVLNSLIMRTGGSLRHLFKAINSSAVITRRRKQERISMDAVNIALEDIKGDLSARISGDDYDFLVKVVKGNHLDSPDNELLKKMMLNEIVLEYNGKRWHNVHPLITEYLHEIGRI